MAQGQLEHAASDQPKPYYYDKARVPPRSQSPTLSFLCPTLIPSLSYFLSLFQSQNYHYNFIRIWRGKKNNFADQLDNPSLSLKTYLYFIFYHEMCFTLNYFFNECVNLELWNWWVRFGLFGGPCKLPERRRGDGAIAIQSCGLDCISHYPAPLSPKPLSFAPYQFSPFNNWSKTQQVDIEKACLEISTISHNRR